jgi:Skp family chaperone for outer membrane proteins
MGNKEMIKVLEEEFRKTHEKLDKIEKELKRLEEEEEDENSQVMQNDLIFTSTGELLNTEKEK